MLDEKDETILEELRKSGRDSTADISRRTGIPRVTVHERIKRMQEKGIIKKKNGEKINKILLNNG